MSFFCPRCPPYAQQFVNLGPPVPHGDGAYEYNVSLFILCNRLTDS